jgi:transcriptional regulator with XRE-family HTH domain
MSFLSHLRFQLDLTQVAFARALGLSQPYLCLLENGSRPLTPELEAKVLSTFALSPTDLPPSLNAVPPSADSLAASLAALGYPAFAHLPHGPVQNPAALALECLRQPDMEVRVLEALPWLLRHFPALDSNWLVLNARMHNLQNRLGFLVELAQQLGPMPHLEALLAGLLPSKLAAEQTLCNDNMPAALRRWLATNRSTLAATWNLLTDLQVRDLSYANS